MVFKKKNLIISFMIIVIVGLLLCIGALKQRQSDRTIVLIVNNYPVNQICYDYYFYSYYNSYMKNYSLLMDYMEIDPDVDIMIQKYDEDRTFKEYFDDCAKDQIIKIQALKDDGIKNGFIYDAQKEYDDYLEQVSNSLNGKTSSINKYFKTFFGPLANKDNVMEYMVDGYYAMGYYKELLLETMSKYPASLDENEKKSRAIDEVAEYVNELKEEYEITYR